MTITTTYTTADKRFKATLKASTIDEAQRLVAHLDAFFTSPEPQCQHERVSNGICADCGMADLGVSPDDCDHPTMPLGGKCEFCGIQGQDRPVWDRLFTIGDESFSLLEFLEVNKDAYDEDDEEIGLIKALAVGACVTIGGGAAAEFAVKRIR